MSKKQPTPEEMQVEKFRNIASLSKPFLRVIGLDGITFSDVPTPPFISLSDGKTTLCIFLTPEQAEAVKSGYYDSLHDLDRDHARAKRGQEEPIPAEFFDPQMTAGILKAVKKAK